MSEDTEFFEFSSYYKYRFNYRSLTNEDVTMSLHDDLCNTADIYRMLLQKVMKREELIELGFDEDD